MKMLWLRLRLSSPPRGEISLEPVSGGSVMVDPPGLQANFAFIPTLC
ncbi:MAG: hypothetical protein LBD42_06275 [Desulfovibrio sp.]|nr:hypothetical protein [Desulfovibrio sp.]